MLSQPSVYSLVQRALGGRNAHRCLVERHLRPRPGERLLDIGCGPADILALLPELRYLGIDASARYVAAARRRHGGRGEFRCAAVGAASVPAGAFDAVIAVGVLHHLDDEGAGALFALAAGALHAGGRLATLDPALTPATPRVARWLMARDRGARVREPERYRQLAEPHFGSVTVTVHDDLARVPYTHAALECRP